MDRPTLHPSPVFDDRPPAAALPLHRRLRTLGLKLLKLFFTILFFPLVSRPRESEEHTPATRLLRAILYRLAVLPLIVTALVTAQLFAATRPLLSLPGLTPSVRTPDPSALGLYFETISLTAADGVVSTAWLVPTLDAARVLEQRDALYTTRHPAVLLIHDHYTNPDQMLPHLTALHRAGYTTLTLALRGTHTENPAPRTFGLTESRDVTAALTYLRSRPTIDPTQIAILTQGTGLTAALLATSTSNPIPITALNPPDPTQTPLASPIPALHFLTPLTQTAFESLHHVTLSDTHRNTPPQPALRLQSHLQPQQAKTD